MQVSNGTIWQAKGPLGELIKQPLPIKSAYWLAKLARQIGEQYAIIDQLRAKLIVQYGTDDGKGNTTIKPGDENWQAFASAFNELMEMTADLKGEKVKVPANDDLTVSPADLMALEEFVEVVV